MKAVLSYLKEQRAAVAMVVLFVFVGLLGFGIYQLVTYSLPMINGDYRTAQDSYAGDRAVALYDQAIVKYHQGDYDQASTLLVAAASECNDSSGHLPDSRKLLVSDIQLLRGNSLVKLQQIQAAVEAYQESLRMNPDNLNAKYNLELLQQIPPSGNSPKTPPPAKGSNKKGV